MQFRTGIVALVVVGEKSKECTNSEQIYEFLTDNSICTKLAEEAMGWSESVNANYGVGILIEKEFSMYMY